MAGEPAGSPCRALSVSRPPHRAGSSAIFTCVDPDRPNGGSSVHLELGDGLRRPGRADGSRVREKPAHGRANVRLVQTLPTTYASEGVARHGRLRRCPSGHATGSPSPRPRPERQVLTDALTGHSWDPDDGCLDVVGRLLRRTGCCPMVRPCKHARSRPGAIDAAPEPAPHLPARCSAPASAATETLPAGGFCREGPLRTEPAARPGMPIPPESPTQGPRVARRGRTVPTRPTRAWARRRPAQHGCVPPRAPARQPSGRSSGTCSTSRGG